MSDTSLVPMTPAASNQAALIPKPTRVPLKGLPPTAFQHPLDPLILFPSNAQELWMSGLAVLNIATSWWVSGRALWPQRR